MNNCWYGNVGKDGNAESVTTDPPGPLMPSPFEFKRYGQSGKLVSEKCGDENSVGMVKFYRTECFTQIGGFVRELMWDGIDCHRCRMLGWIAVMPHPYFGVTGDNGTTKIENVPPGPIGDWIPELRRRSRLKAG